MVAVVPVILYGLPVSTSGVPTPFRQRTDLPDKK